MKRSITYLLLVFIVLMSCSKDNDPDPQDPIIGKWGRLLKVENGITTPYDPTDVNNQVEIKANGTLTYLGTSPTTASWSNEGKGNYKMGISYNGIPVLVTFKVSFVSNQSKEQMIWIEASLGRTDTWEKIN